MTFAVDYDKFTILSKVRNYFTIRIYRRANITHKPSSSVGGYFSSVTVVCITAMISDILIVRPKSFKWSIIGICASLTLKERLQG